MTDRPILFSGPMVRALLDGRKTQTRRVLKAQPADLGGPSGCKTVAEYCTGAPEKGLAYYWRGQGGSWNSTGPFFTPYKIGDRLWVRERWTTGQHLDAVKPSLINPSQSIGYPATEDGPWLGKLRPSIFMPRWASRITLTVTDVRVQRLQDISDDDAKAEGVNRLHGGYHDDDDVYENYLGGRDFGGSRAATQSFKTLWDSLNADRGFSWEVNPWIVAYTFTVQKSNIDVALN